MPGLIPLAEVHRRTDNLLLPVTAVDRDGNSGNQHPQEHQPADGPHDPVDYGELMDLDSLLNYVADQHNGGTNDPVPPDVMAYATDKSYYSRLVVLFSCDIFNLL